MNIKVDENVWMRSLAVDDLVHIRALLNDPAVEEMLVGWNFPLNPDEHERWFKNLPMKADTQRFAIVADHMWLGFAGLWGINWKDRHASTGLALAKEGQGQGLGTKVIHALSNYAFGVLNLHRLEAEILGYNAASQKLYGKCGYEAEGVQKKKVFKRGAYQDLHLYALLAENHRVNG